MPRLDEPSSRRPSRNWAGRLTLTCISIALNAATAGGIFTFPILSPALSSRLHLTQPQLTTIVLAATAGQYPFASLVGSVIDNIGPWACSLTSAILFFAGFGMFSLELRNPPTQFAVGSFYRLVLFFFLGGLGTVTSYFSALFCASKNFPKHFGVASGCTMAIFGLSPMILSLFASTFFTDSTYNLDVSGFTAFLAILSGITNGFGAIILRVESQESEYFSLVTPSETDRLQEIEPNSENSPPLKPAINARGDNVLDVLRDYQFWILMLFIALVLSPCEMVISNVGTISMALPERSISRSLQTGASTATTQVRLLSLSNTISRVVAGTVADFISPVASYLPSGVLVLPRRHKINRVCFLLGSNILVLFAFIWMNLVVTNQSQIWIFSVAIGVAYGTVFTVLPSIVSSIWGIQNLARNFGLLTYAPFVGTPLFSYLYAFIASAATDKEGICEGKRCWTLTFYVSMGGALVATGLSGLLWRNWRGKL